MPTDIRLPKANQRLSFDDRVDLICDEFEQQWQAGSTPEIGHFLTTCNDLECAQIFRELLLLDIDYRTRNGTEVEKAYYLKRFPQLAGEIESVCFVLEDHLTASHERFLDSDASTVATESFEGDIRRVGRYVLTDKVGAGAAGEVWKAYDPRLERTVAIKVPHGSSLSEAEFELILREGRTIAQLRHSNIVAIHEVERSNGYAFIVSDFIEGTDLRKRLDAEKLSHRTVAELCATIADALHYAHERGVIHRDLKPANVLLDSNLQPHIADFGLAKLTDGQRSITLEGQLVGTIAYMSPEQARGDSAGIDGRSDVYSLGVLLFEMLTGSRPFQGEAAVVLQAIVERLVPSPRSLDPRIPRDLETICLKALEKDPARRYATARSLAVDLRQFLNGEPILARRSSVFEQARRLVSRRPALFACVGMFLVALGAFVMAYGLNETNRALVGWQRVHLTTTPEGAEVAFVPLDEITGEPTPSNLIRAQGRTPVIQELKPGDYLVIAVLEDGRFHEVQRHVPRDPKKMAGGQNHLFWRVDADGTVLLPTIALPSSDIMTPMATVDASEFSASFCVDRAAFTYQEYRDKVNSSGRLPNLEEAPASMSLPMPVTFDQAQFYAEIMGKRLPSEAEYKLIRSRQDLALSIPQLREFDRSETSNVVDMMSGTQNNQVTGLWTSSWALAGREPFDATRGTEPFPEAGYIVVGTLGVADQADAANTSPLRRMIFSRDTLTPPIGFRCVRSFRPRFIH